MRKLTDKEMACRAPFRDRDSRLPTSVLPRELPIEGETADVVAIVTQYGKWLAESNVPKLFIAAEPGALLIGRAREFCQGWHNQQMVTVKGIHFIQEISPTGLPNLRRTYV